MSELLFDYGLFLAKTVTFVAAVLVIIAAGAAASRKVSGAEGLAAVRICEAARQMFRERYDTDVPPEDFLPFVGAGEAKYIGGPAEKRVKEAIGRARTSA